MNILHISVINKVATYQQRDGAIVCGNSDYQIEFTFDDEWNASTYKTARFVYSRGSELIHQDVDFTGNTVIAPVLTKTTEVYVGIFAGELRTSTPAVIPCKLSILCESGEPAIPSPEIDARIMQLLNTAISLEERAEQAAIKATEAALESATPIVLAASGESVTLNNSALRAIQGLNVLGKTVQNGTPTQSVPIPLENAGGDGAALLSIEGSNAEPQHFIMTTSNGICGIPVTSGGNYTDSNGQQWITDEIDLERGVLIKRTHTQTFKGTEPFSALGSTGDANAFFYIVDSSVKPLTVNNEGFSLCSHYERKPIISSTIDIGHQVRGLSSGTQYRILFRPNNVKNMTPASFQTWLKSNPTTVTYALATATEIPLSAEDIEAFKSVHTNYPTTVITSDNDAYMSVKYVVDTKTYIDNKLSELVASIKEG